MFFYGVCFRFGVFFLFSCGELLLLIMFLDFIVVILNFFIVFFFSLFILVIGCFMVIVCGVGFCFVVILVVF